MLAHSMVRCVSSQIAVAVHCSHNAICHRSSNASDYQHLDCAYIAKTIIGQPMPSCK